ADVWANGVISRANGYANAAGLRAGMHVSDAARGLLQAPAHLILDSTNREVVAYGPRGQNIVCTNSIADALPEDRDRNVLCTAARTGRSGIGYIRRVRPLGFSGSAGAMGKGESGIAALAPAEAARSPGGAVSAATARMGDG